MTKELKHVDPKKLSGCPKCSSYAFYDWGIELADVTDYPTIAAGEDVQQRWSGTTAMKPVKVCVGCHNPYVQEGGEFIDASTVLSAEDIQGLLRMQQGSLTPPKAKDP